MEGAVQEVADELRAGGARTHLAGSILVGIVRVVPAGIGKPSVKKT